MHKAMRTSLEFLSNGMASMAATPNISIRLAKESDLTAILGLLLTSFRQFPLFDFLYSPLNKNFNFAHDTVFFWRRRLLLDLLDPEASIIVAEVPADSILPVSKDQDPLYLKSVAALEWTEQNGLSLRSSLNSDHVIVGFAIWRSMGDGEAGSRGAEDKAAVSWYDKVKATRISWEVSFWKMLYQRKDQDPERYTAYLAAEEELSKTYYQEPCYYLDNLCVDFRYHRYGIGTLLLRWGLKVAQDLERWVGTEAGPQGLGLYLKHGFKQIGWFTVAVHGEEHRSPVMRLDFVPASHEVDKVLQTSEASTSSI